LPSVSEVTEQDNGLYNVKSNSGKDIRDDVARLSIDNGWGLKELRSRSNTLEDVFLNVISSEIEQ
jgi:hypothetical protein